MKTEYNSQAFTPEEVEKGLHLDLFNCLSRFNQESEEYVNDIHIWHDGYCTVIEWVQIPRSHEWGGKFEFLDEGEVKAMEVLLPDNSIEYVFDEEEAQEVLKRYEEEHKEKEV